MLALMGDESFVPDTVDDTDKLQLTFSSFGLLADKFKISSRFAGLIHMQLQPSRHLEYDRQSRTLSRIQFIYSAVIRSLGAAENPKDPTKRLLNWQRLIACKSSSNGTLEWQPIAIFP
jgi:hypothetical protein